MVIMITLSPPWRAEGHDASSSPVHQWVADQAKNLWSVPEILDKLPQDWSDDIVTLDSYEILYGTRYEDEEYSAEFSGCWAWHPYCNHFWNPMNPDHPYDEGLVYGGKQWQSAYRRAQTLWDSHVIPSYAEGRISEAYEWLGRVVHLLTDMSVPAHVNKVSPNWGRFDIHIPAVDPDSYEDYVKSSLNYKTWPASGSMRYAPTLYELFRSMAEIAQRFDSNDADGYEDAGTRRRDGLTTEELREIGDVLMPEAIRHVAGLYHLFWDLTHSSQGAPEPPTGVSASDGTYTDKVEVIWNASPGAVSYEIWRNAVEDSATATQLAGSVHQTRYDDFTAGAGTTYYYWVKARNSLGTSNFSESDSGYREASTLWKIEPAAGTIGTELTITAEGFGTRRGKVYIGTLGCTVLSWSDTSVRCRMTKPVPAGTYAVSVLPKGASAIVMENAFTVRPPEIDSVEPPSGKSGERITIKGGFFGTKKPSVSLGTRKCKVLSPTMNSTTGVSSVVFLVPKGLAPGTYDVRLANQIGSVIETGGFVVN